MKTNARRTLFRICLLTALLSQLAVVQAQFNYTTNNGTITITGYTGAGGAVVIPDTINGLPVTIIGYGAFYLSSLSSITVPDSVTGIGDYAFGFCDGLTSIIIPKSVSDIGYAAFYGCGLTNVTIPSNVTSIGDNPFIGCNNLTAINVDATNLSYSSVSGVLFNKNRTRLIQYPAAKAADSYTIPNSVTNIMAGSFRSSVNLNNVIVGNGVITFTIAAFDYCNRLKGIYFLGNAPDAVLVINGGETLPQPTVYYLPGTTGWNSYFANLSTSLWLPQAETGDTNFGVWTNQFGFTINWASGQTVVVEASANMVNPMWQPVQTNTLTSDSVYFNDPQWTNYPARFYRLRAP